MVVVDEAFKTAGKKPGIEIWRIKKFQCIAILPNEHGYFYSGDSYIVLSTRPHEGWNVHFWLGTETSQTVQHGENASNFDYAVHFWLGKDSTPDELGTAAAKTVELDNLLGGGPVQYREIQEYESPLFVSYFKEGLKYLRGGYESGFKKVSGSQKWTPRLFHCKGKRVVRCKQVEVSRDSLNLGDVFILDNKSDIYVWCPPESGRLERQKGLEVATSIRDSERAGRGNIHVLDHDWNSHESFWRFVGGKGPVKSAEAGGVDLGHWIKEKPMVALHKVSDATGKMEILKIAESEVAHSMLDSKDAFILDAASGGIYVWIGKGCTMDERKKAMQYAAEYLEIKQLPKCTQVIRILESAEPAVFMQWLSQPKKKVNFTPRLYECSDESGRLTVNEIADYKQEDLDGDDVMILDVGETIFVWIGQKANENEKTAAQDTAKKYLSNDALPRPSGAKIVTMQQGKESADFTRYFKKWDANLWKTKKTFEDMKNLAIASR